MKVQVTVGLIFALCFALCFQPCRTLKEDEETALAQLSLNWFVKNKLSVQIPTMRVDRVHCVEQQINCDAEEVLDYGEFKYVYGLGSSVLKPLTSFLATASVANIAAQAELTSWSYAKACPLNETVPFECFFRPICPLRATDYAKTESFHGIGASVVQKHTRVLKERCDASYEEVMSGLTKHLQFNFDPTSFAEEMFTEGTPPSVSSVVLNAEPEDIGAYAAVHIRLRKNVGEYVDKRDFSVAQTPDFWLELFKQLLASGFKQVYVATDRCRFLHDLPEVSGQTRLSSCYHSNGLKFKHDAHKTAVAYAALKMDLYRLYHATHFYADFNSNMDIIIARMRSFHNVTLALGGLKGKFSGDYGDEVP